MTTIRMNVTDTLPKRDRRNTVTTSDTLVRHIARLFTTSLIVGSLCSPLLFYVIHLWQTRTGSANLTDLHWYELVALLLLLLLPVYAVKLLKIVWTARDIPGGLDQRR